MANRNAKVFIRTSVFIKKFFWFSFPSFEPIRKHFAKGESGILILLVISFGKSQKRVLF